MSEWLTVTEDTVILNRDPVEMVRKALCEWADRHGVDPTDVCVPGWMVRNVPERRVDFLTVERDEQGRGVIDGDDFKRAIGHVQLEAPPLPWPRIVAIHQDPIPPVRDPREDT